jgi:hypothetical protein
MVRHVRLMLAVGGNVLVALSALASLGAYTSGDASGLQYLLLVPAAGLAGAAIAVGCLLGLLSLRCPRAWTNPALAAVALLVAMLPQATGLGYTGAVLDLPGAVLAAALLPLAAILTVAVVRGLGPLAT